MPDNLDQILESSAAERLATGFEFTEGPLWHLVTPLYRRS